MISRFLTELVPTALKNRPEIANEWIELFTTWEKDTLSSSKYGMKMTIME